MRRSSANGVARLCKELLSLLYFSSFASSTLSSVDEVRTGQEVGEFDLRKQRRFQFSERLYGKQRLDIIRDLLLALSPELNLQPLSSGQTTLHRATAPVAIGLRSKNKKVETVCESDESEDSDKNDVSDEINVNESDEIDMSDASNPNESDQSVRPKIDDCSTVGIDFGLKRVGVAIASDFLASPKCILDCKGATTFAYLDIAEKIKTIIENEAIEQIVVGMPYVDGEPDKLMGPRIQDFTKVLADALTPVPVFTFDESFSSAEASFYMKPGKPQRLDADAAACILRAFIANGGRDAIHVAPKVAKNPNPPKQLSLDELLALEDGGASARIGRLKRKKRHKKRLH